jgi:hypothetical protein
MSYVAEISLIAPEDIRPAPEIDPEWPSNSDNLPNGVPPNGEHKTWPEFCQWIQGKTYIRAAYEPNDYRGAVGIVFSDGSRAWIHSNYEGPLSDVTPGAGLEIPTVVIWDSSK